MSPEKKDLGSADENFQPADQAEQPDKQEETPEEKEKRMNGPWTVARDRTGKLLGLPEHVSEKDVVVYYGPDGKLLAEIPSKDRLQERKEWEG